MYDFNFESTLKYLEVLSSGHWDPSLERREGILKGVCTHFGYLFWGTLQVLCWKSGKTQHF